MLIRLKNNKILWGQFLQFFGSNGFVKYFLKKTDFSLKMTFRLVHLRIERNERISTFFQETLRSLDETENFPTRKQNAIPKLFF